MIKVWIESLNVELNMLLDVREKEILTPSDLETLNIRIYKLKKYILKVKILDKD
ncbi:MAG: hypothetical protein ACRCZ0_08655 [Cetobacterium sp.]